MLPYLWIFILLLPIHSTAILYPLIEYDFLQRECANKQFSNHGQHVLGSLTAQSNIKCLPSIGISSKFQSINNNMSLFIQNIIGNDLTISLWYKADPNLTTSLPIMSIKPLDSNNLCSDLFSVRLLFNLSFENFYFLHIDSRFNNFPATETIQVNNLTQ